MKTSAEAVHWSSRFLSKLFLHCRALREGSEWENLSEARKRIVESELRDFVLGGVALEVQSLPAFYIVIPTRL